MHVFASYSELHRLVAAKAAVNEEYPLRHNQNLKRVLWRIQEPVESAIFVIKHMDHPLRELEPYKNVQGEIHPMLLESVMTPRVASLDVGIVPMDGDADEDESSSDGSEDADVSGYGPSVVSVRPGSKPYVTINDYILAVHPTLIRYREEIVETENECRQRGWTNQTKLVAFASIAESLEVEAEEEYLGEISGENERLGRACPPNMIRPNPQITPTAAAVRGDRDDDGFFYPEHIWRSYKHVIRCCERIAGSEFVKDMSQIVLERPEMVEVYKEDLMGIVPRVEHPVEWLVAYQSRMGPGTLPVFEKVQSARTMAR